MNKTVIGVVLIIATALLIGFFIYSYNTRYHLQTVPQGGAAYKTDRKTGKTWVVYGDTELPVRPPFAPYEAPEDKAIKLTKDSNIFESETRTEDMIKNWMKEEKGNLHVIGWDAKKIDEQTYLVGYTYNKNSGEVGYFFEVNLAAEIVRNVKGDPELEKKYREPPKIKGEIKKPKPKFTPKKDIKKKRKKPTINVTGKPKLEKKQVIPPTPPAPKIEGETKEPKPKFTPKKDIEEKEGEKG